MLDSKNNFLATFPFWLSLGLVALIWFAAIWGGWFLIIVILTSWILFSSLEAFLVLDLENDTPEPDDALIFWYQLLTIGWTPLLFTTLFGLIWYCAHSNLSQLEKFGLFFSVGTITGTISINYARELILQSEHKKSALADILLSIFLYSYFRSEQFLGHRKFIGTPRDTVTARYNEGFYRFLQRILKQRWLSGLQVEKANLTRKKLAWYDRKNPFYLYGVLHVGMGLLASLLGGWGGLALFLWQSLVAICSLEIVNYIEHYGLTRKHFGNGKYEQVQPHHSWSSAQKGANWLSINLKHHSSAGAPQLPFGYAIMSTIALFPSLWRKIMNPKVQKWRAMYYPEIQDWSKYNKAGNLASIGAQQKTT